MGEYADMLIDDGMLGDWPFGPPRPRNTRRSIPRTIDECDPTELIREGDPCLENTCDGHYVMRVNGKTEHEFLGCSNYPDCRSSI